jgi:carboxyl-terminal processing protease
MRVVRLGVNTLGDSVPVTVISVVSGGAASRAGIEAGDELIKVGDIEVKDPSFGVAFRGRYGNAEGTTIPVVVRRGGVERTLQLVVRKELVIEARLDWDPAAGVKAARIRRGILSGTTGN